MHQGDADEESPAATSNEMAGHGHDAIDGGFAELRCATNIILLLHTRHMLRIDAEAQSSVKQL